MNRLYPLLLLIVAGLCFYAGYTVGVNKLPTAPSVEAVTTSEPAAIETVEAVETVEDAVPAPLPVEPVVEAMVTDHEHSLRAAKRQITFTDNQDRELVVEVMEAKADSIKVRRVRDQQIVNLPINMLCEADQVFANYLVNQTQAEEAPSDLSMEDQVWEDLFK